MTNSLKKAYKILQTRFDIKIDVSFNRLSAQSCMNMDYCLREFVEIKGNVFKNEPETKNGNENLSSLVYQG